MAAVGPRRLEREPADTLVRAAGDGALADADLRRHVPAGADPGDYHVEATATSGSVEVHGTGSVQVLGDTIEFSPGTRPRSRG